MTDTNQRGQDGREIALEARAEMAGKLHSPSVARNTGPIRAAFSAMMPTKGTILEIGAGTGEHGHALTKAHPSLFWQPVEPDPASRRSIAAWAADGLNGRMHSPIAAHLETDGPSDPSVLSAHTYVGVVCINVLHIAPWSAAEGLFRTAAQALGPEGRLFLYGPFSRRGEMAEGNQRFDADLKRRDPAWGVRDLDDQLQPLGARHGFHLVAVQEMPANNLSVAFEKG